MHYFLVVLYFHGNGDSRNNIQEINWFWIRLNSNQPFAGIEWDLSVLIPSVSKSNWPSQRHTHLPISYLARCDNIRFHWTPEWKEPTLPKSAGLILHSSIWKSVFKLGKKPRLSLFRLHTWETLRFFHLKVQFFTSNVPDLLRHSSCYFDVDCETVFTQRGGRGSKERMCASGKWREDLVTCQSQDNHSG